METSLIHWLLLGCPRSIRRLPAGQRPIGLEEAKQEIERHITDFRRICAATRLKAREKVEALESKSFEVQEDKFNRNRARLDTLTSEVAQYEAAVRDFEAQQAASKQDPTQRAACQDAKSKLDAQQRDINRKLAVLRAASDQGRAVTQQLRQSLTERDRRETELKAKFNEGLQELRADLNDPSSELSQELIDICARFAFRPGQRRQWRKEVRDVISVILNEMLVSIGRQMQDNVASHAAQPQLMKEGGKEKEETAEQSPVAAKAALMESATM